MAIDINIDLHPVFILQPRHLNNAQDKGLKIDPLHLMALFRFRPRLEIFNDGVAMLNLLSNSLHRPDKFRRITAFFKPIGTSFGVVTNCH